VLSALKVQRRFNASIDALNLHKSLPAPRGRVTHLELELYFKRTFSLYVVVVLSWLGLCVHCLVQPNIGQQRNHPTPQDCFIKQPFKRLILKRQAADWTMDDMDVNISTFKMTDSTVRCQRQSHTPPAYGRNCNRIRIENHT
jgi:hypothetical protein